MSRQAARLGAKQTALSPESDLLWHAAVRPLADHEAPLAEHQAPRSDGRDFSRVPVHASGPDAGHAEISCPLTPTRSPFDGACHTCPAHVQAKLKVSRPDDEYEREADRVADTVMRMAEPKDGEREECRAPGCSAVVQRRAASSAALDEAPPIVHEVLRSPGQPLDAQTRAFTEPRFGHDFSQVRAHTGEQADSSARSLNALAYTAGNDVVFRAGQYSPNTQEGRRLLAHELAHVVQQSEPGWIYRSAVDDRRSKIVATALSLSEEHYLMGAAGQIPDQGGGVNDRNVTLDPKHHAASIGVYRGKDIGTVTYVCGGRYSKATSLPKGDPESKEHQSSPRKYKWKHGDEYGEACEGKRHFDCGGFVSYCYHQACPEVTYPGPASGLLTDDYGWQGVAKDAVKAGDVAYRPGHAGLCISNTQAISALGRKWGVQKEAVGAYSQFGRLKCLVEPVQSTRTEESAESKAGPESSTSPSALPERRETEL